MRRVLAVLACAFAAGALVACGSGQPPSAGPTRVTPPGSPSAPSSGAPALSAEPPGQSSGAPRRSDCVASTDEATVRPNEEVGPVCLLVGAKLEVTSAPSPTQPWQLLVPSDATVLRCTSTAGPNGTVSGTCQALKAGTAVLSTQTKSPTDGASDRWRLTVVVQ